MYNQNLTYLAVDPRLVSSGLQQDLQDLRKMLWASSANVRFYEGKIRRLIPSALITLPEAGGVARGIAQQQASDGTRWLWMASKDAVYRWYGVGTGDLIYTFATPGTTDQNSLYEATFIDMTPWGDWMVLNNGVDKARLYKPGSPDTTDEIAEAPAAVRQYMKKFNFLLAVGYGSRGTRVGWSDSDGIESWIVAPGSLSGSLSIDDFDTGIKAASRLGQFISVFNEDQMGVVFYTGDDYVFGQRMVLDGIGAIGKRAVCSDGQSNYGVGRNGVWWTDGNSSRYIDKGFQRDYLQDGVNWDQGSKIHAARNDITGCIEFYFPMLGSNVCNEGWSYDPSTQGWSPIPACSVQDERKIFAAPIQGHDVTTGIFTKGEFRLAANNSALAGALALATKPLLMQMKSGEGYLDIHTDTAIDEVVLVIKAATAVQFRMESCERIGAAWEVSAWQDVAVGANTYSIEQTIPSGTYWRLVFQSTATDWNLDLQGFILFGHVEGTNRS